MDAKELPACPNLAQYKKQAKELVKACQSGAKGRATWGGLARARGHRGADAIRGIKKFVPRLRKLPDSEVLSAKFTLADAQWVIAREHAFESWPKFAKHIEAVARANSPVSQFELAADAVVSGDVATLQKLLCENPELARARSTREHGATLLHYVSANGVEDFRQKTAKNAVEVAKLLLQAGAEVDAASNSYGGGDTTLGLVATSVHPEVAGVQIALLETLLQAGASIEGLLGSWNPLTAALANGRGEAAAFLAERGARLDLEGAAGVGRLDVVRSFFKDDGTLKPAATQKQMRDGFAWACEFGRTDVVDFLLQKGMELDAKLRHDGQTGLHWAAYGGHAETVKVLLARGAPVSPKDDSYGGTPLGWALYAWGHSMPIESARENYYEVVALLARAGAKLDAKWYEDNEGRRGAAEKLRADERMQAALRGELRSNA